MAHLSSMLGLQTEDAEKHVSTLVTNGTIFARMDRPAGIISFKQPVAPETTLQAWAGDISELLGLMDETCHLISKENMMHKIAA
jgi:26S proteasome regulatory subunit N5